MIKNKIIFNFNFTLPNNKKYFRLVRFWVDYKKQYIKLSRQEGIFQILGKSQDDIRSYFFKTAKYYFNYALLAQVNASINTIYGFQQRILAIDF